MPCKKPRDNINFSADEYNNESQSYFLRQKYYNIICKIGLNCKKAIIFHWFICSTKSMLYMGSYPITITIYIYIYIYIYIFFFFFFFSEGCIFRQQVVIETSFIEDDGTLFIIFNWNFSSLLLIFLVLGSRW